MAGTTTTAAVVAGGSHLMVTMTSGTTGDDVTEETVGHIFASALALAAATKATTFDDVRPVTLSAEWSRLARLLLIACLAVIGSIGNVFMISSVMIEDHLKKAGKFLKHAVILINLINFVLLHLVLNCYSS